MLEIFLAELHMQVLSAVVTVLFDFDTTGVTTISESRKLLCMYYIFTLLPYFKSGFSRSSLRLGPLEQLAYKYINICREEKEVIINIIFNERVLKLIIVSPRNNACQKVFQMRRETRCSVVVHTGENMTYQWVAFVQKQYCGSCIRWIMSLELFLCGFLSARVVSTRGYCKMKRHRYNVLNTCNIGNFHFKILLLKVRCS